MLFEIEERLYLKSKPINQFEPGGKNNNNEYRFFFFKQKKS